MMLDAYFKWHRLLWPSLIRDDLQGCPVFLEVDDDLIESIGCSAGIGRPVEDFCQSVKVAVVQNGNVCLDRVNGEIENGQPRQFAFLCAMVLAAYRMQDSSEASEINYFVRLREILGMQGGKGRPPGMPPGSEEPLWEDWNLWLRRNGYIPTARRGDNRNYRYLNYPLSQVLLRKADKDRLRELFAAYYDDLEMFDDPELISIWLYDKARLTKHLRTLLDGSDTIRYEATIRGIEAEFHNWLKQSNNQIARRRFIHCGLYREEDEISGEVNYYLYPRLPRNWDQKTPLKARIDGRWVELEKDESQPGFLSPILDKELDVCDLTNGAKIPLAEESPYACLRLEKRKFWILIQDPEGSGYATIGQPRRNEPFLFLVRSKLWDQLCGCFVKRSEGEIAFREIGPWKTGDWWEVELELKAWSEDLKRAIGRVDRQLAEKLSPGKGLKIGLRDGLRVEHDGRFAWLKGYGPELALHGPGDAANVVILNIEGEQIWKKENVRIDQSISTPDLEPGRYILEAQSDHGRDEKQIRIISWSEVFYRPPAHPVWSKVHDHIRISGARIDEAREANGHAQS